MSRRTTAYRPSNDVLDTRLNEEESVLLSLSTQRYYSLNDTGSHIWELLPDNQTADEIARALTQQWMVDYETALTYVQLFLRELHDEGLIEPVSESDGECF